MAAVVATNNDPMINNINPSEGVFRTFYFGGYVGDEPMASDGNSVLSMGTPPTTGTNAGSGYAWDLNVQDYADALGNPNGANTLQNDWVLRQSVWMAMDPNDPLLNEGTWTDSIKFEITDRFTSGGTLFGTGNAFPTDFTPSNCDVGAGTCSGGTALSTTEWTQISFSYVVDDFDFSGPLADALNIRPVVFLGDYTTGEAKQGTLFVDNIVIEVFEDLASANATPLPNNMPGGIPSGGSTPLAGDANGDGTVDLLDLDILGTNFGATPATFAQGDFNEDNVVDLLDLDILGTNFGAGASSAVPEPTSTVLVLAGLLGVSLRRRS